MSLADDQRRERGSSVWETGAAESGSGVIDGRRSRDGRSGEWHDPRR